MASDAKKEDSTTKHVLDYYKRFSQNKDLPKYFSGTSVSYLPEIKHDSDNDEQQIDNVTLKTNIDITITPADEKVAEQGADISPSSSIISNRKLEWDNGADIGYDNCQMARTVHKSSSLPLLLEGRQDVDNVVKSQIGQSEASSLDNGSNVKLIIFTHTSSSDSNNDPPKIYSTSSSSFREERKKPFSSSSSSSAPEIVEIGNMSSDSNSKEEIENFKSTLSFLKKKIGLPGAHSTPFAIDEKIGDMPNCSKTPVSQKTEKPVRKLTDELLALMGESSSSDTASKEKDRQVKLKSALKNTKNISKNKKKVVTLCLTKPLTVECACSPQKSPKNKVVQVKSKQSTVGIQTDHVSEKELIKIIAKSQDNINQSVVYCEHFGESSSSNNVGSTQTCSDVAVSNCDSFEFVKNLESVKNGQVSEAIGSDATRSKPSSGQSSNKLVSETRLDKNSDSHSSVVLSAEGMIEQKCAPTDIERNIELLQKLLKSKKYDSSTKRRYIKRLIQNITESKFLEESSTSSELFCPKKTSTAANNKQTIKTLSIETSSESNNSLPKQNNSRVTPRNGLGIKTFSHNISPRKSVVARDELTSTSEIIPFDSTRDTRKNLFTLTKNEFSVNQEACSRQNSNEEASSLEKQCHSSSSGRSYQNWKEDRTVSEKVFEGQHGDGNGVEENLADEERAYQMTLINKEIDQLNKLKNALKKKPTTKDLRRTTSVYRLSRDASSTPSRKPRKYVIETFVDGKLSGNLDYQIDGRKYSIEKEGTTTVQGGNQQNKKARRQMMGDIQVVKSSDTTVQIKVSTFCETCKRSPCVCVTDFLGCLNNPFALLPSVGELDAKLYESSHNYNDSCSCTAATTKSSSSSAKTVCLSCHNRQCICNNTSAAFARRCSVCKSSPCSCSAMYAGHFLPARLPSAVEDHRFATASTSKSSKSQVKSQKSYESENGSLKRVFENCACNTEQSCTCNFVEKLLKHFDLRNNVQTPPPQSKPEINSENIGIQTYTETCSKNLQTSKHDEHKITQTDKKDLWKCADSSIQTHLDTKNQITETVQRFFDSKTIQTDTSEHRHDSRDKETIADVRVFDTVDVSTNTSQVPNEEGNLNQVRQIGQQIVFEDGQTMTDSVPTYTRSTSPREGENTKCICTQTHSSAATYPMDKSRSQMGKSEKKIHFIGSDSELEKAQRKQSIGCTCNLNSNVLRKSSHSSSESRAIIGTDGARMDLPEDQGRKRTVEMSSVGTCRCGFSDKVYIDEKPQTINSGSSEMFQERGAYSGTSTSTTSAFEKTATSETSSTDATVICICCEQNKPMKHVTILAHNNREFPLCHDCIEKRSMLTSVCYTGPGQISSKISSDTEQKNTSASKNTTVQTDNEDFCTCTKPRRVNNHSAYCSHCRNKLKKTVKSKNGIAYTLTLECDSPGKFKTKKVRKKPLEEIKVKVPGPYYSGKKFKDRENFNRKSGDRIRRKGRSFCDENSTNLEESNRDSTKIGNHEPVKTRRGLTLQDYLRQNRPDFINSAEFRRQAVNDYRVIRELSKDQVKLRFLEEQLQNEEFERQGKLFSEKEMKEITKRNYKKLPEVQKKLIDDRYRRLRTADKFIVDTFAKKIQRSVLKGKRNFPIDTNIVSIVV